MGLISTTLGYQGRFQRNATPNLDDTANKTTADTSLL